ncbi:LysR family transcriptional regulator [Caulobacter sp. KR2-114]|uniref:LysR family transcriptional regulator n=1 Tax=Caulobacter sp. KR2-114 TaxID=3400912 RepID=UPI003C0CFCEB
MTGAAPDWSLYRTFLAVMEEGSLSAAARALGIAQPTVGRHIEALELALGGDALFTRSPGGLMPTEAALALRPHAQAMAAAAEALVRTASGAAEAAAGTVRVTASEIMGAEVLPPILTDFHEAHPQVSIELALSNRNEDLLRREADIAVRMARPTQEALLARRIGLVWVGLFAHRRYLQRHGEPQAMDDPGQVAVGFDRDASIPKSVASLGLPPARQFFAFRSDSDLAQLSAVRAGFGIGGCMFGLAARDPNLVHVLKGTRFSMEMWVVMHEDLKASRRMRLMFDHLVEGLTAYAATSQPPA